jgi:hypothetical protein
MSIKFTCPHCKRGMSVDDRMAGKKGRCGACQQIITVPNLASSPAFPKTLKPGQPASSKEKSPTPPVDVETEAAALFSDEPPPAAPTEVKTIDLNCPYCDEPIQFSADLAGKRAPCPECTHIIKVPELAKNQPKDWRKAEPRGPSGARLPDQPAPEGTWSSATVSAVSKEALVEVGVIPTKRPPRTVAQKIRLPALAAVGVVLLSVGSWLGYRWWNQQGIERALKEAIDFADSEQGGKEAKAVGQAAIHLGAGEYYLNSQTASCAKKARDQFGKALALLQTAPAETERDAVLGDLALAQVDLGGDEEDARQELRLPWTDTLRRVQATLSNIQHPDVRREAVRVVCRRLIARGQISGVRYLVGSVYSNPDDQQAEALAVVGLELLKASDKQSAEKALEEALKLYSVKDPPPVRPTVVALAVILQKAPPKPGKKHEEDKANDHVGQVEALARQEQWDEARQKAQLERNGEIFQFQALLAVAAAAVDNKVPNTNDVEAAIKLAETKLRDKPELSWPLLRLTQLALRAGLSEERLRALAAVIADRSLRGRAHLAIFRAQAALSKQEIEESAADKVETKSLSHALASRELARHNIRLNSSWAPTVQGWQQPLKAFGSLGIALGLQDRDKGQGDKATR